jgi:uncharacterized lipoprotein YajG
MKRSILSAITILLALAFLASCANKNEEMIVTTSSSEKKAAPAPSPKP